MRTQIIRSVAIAGLTALMLGAVWFSGCNDNGGTAECGDNDTDADAGSDTDTDDCPDSVCGPCAQVSYGQTYVSGDPRIDGVFKAVYLYHNSVESRIAGLENSIRSVAVCFGVADSDVLPISDLVPEITTAIQAELVAATEYGVQVEMTGPTCSSDGVVAYNGQYDCEASLGCEASPDWHEFWNEIAGQCDGRCLGTCTGACSRWICEEPAVIIDGACAGACEGGCAEGISGGTCDGVCEGSCSGECSAYAYGDGSEYPCQGYCYGSCTGNCVRFGSPDCGGECRGSCAFEVGDSGECSDGSLRCDGDCDDGCNRCWGQLAVATNNPDCDVTPECRISSAMQGMAETSCSPISVDLYYDLVAELLIDPLNGASVDARMSCLDDEISTIVENVYVLRTLADDGFAGDNGFQALEGVLTSRLQELQSEGIAEIVGNYDIADGLVPCVMPALDESLTLTADVRDDAAAAIAAGAEVMVSVGVE